MKKFPIVLISAFSCISVHGQTADVDTTAFSHTLNEVIITAPETMSIGNKTVYSPSKALRENTNSASQLLAGLQIPELIVNPSTGSIAIMGGGKLSIRINGRPASENDLKSLAPENISKVEYIANPGVRYGDADAVLDVSIKKPLDSGYSVFANVLQSANRGWGDYTGTLKYNVGRSEWSADYQSNPMWDMDAYRDNTEHIVLSNGGVMRREERGIKTPNRMVTHRAALQYSYAEGRNTLFNVQARLFRTNDCYRSTGEITTILGTQSWTDMEYEENPVKSWQGDLDIYFHRRMNRRHSIYINIVPTITDSKSGRIYDNGLTLIDNNIDGRGYRLSGEALWEGRISQGTMTAGYRTNAAWNKSEFFPAETVLHQRDATHNLFAEWKQTFSQWQYYVGGNLAYYKATEPISNNYIGFSPRIFVKYSPFNWGAVAIYGDGTTVTPGINELNPVLEQIDQYQWSQGNPDLEPFQRYNGRLELDFKYLNHAAKITVSNTYCHKPVMAAKGYEDDHIIRKLYNAGYHNEFEVKGQIRLPLLNNLLTFSCEGGWHSFISKGLDYRYTYSQPFVNAQLMVMKGHWWGMVKFNSTYNRLWGETISAATNNLTILGIGYTYRHATFMAGWVNPFGNVNLKSLDLSEIAGYDRTYQATGSHQLIWLGVTLNLRHGKNRAASQRKIDNQHQYEQINNVKK